MDCHFLHLRLRLSSSALFREKPETNGDLRDLEELAEEGDHAVHEIDLDKAAAENVGVLGPKSISI